MTSCAIINVIQHTNKLSSNCQSGIDNRTHARWTRMEAGCLVGEGLRKSGKRCTFGLRSFLPALSLLSLFSFSLLFLLSGGWFGPCGLFLSPSSSRVSVLQQPLVQSQGTAVSTFPFGHK
ncbi:hypothetical protein CC80DRAFT_100402 [Byssothecium circinans]|uniref:Uncharacterized protein n=1 Tax=Byssothecium circinans TaxID=147558 RepID=A0A6A5UF25_9PLEO|nr:hypothetical protein CC80DRAFT_100402 [Byssothecium circinans]